MEPFLLHPTPLTPQSFSSFGHVISNPANTPGATVTGQTANQGTALKYPNISPLHNGYHAAPSGKPGQAAMTLFVCTPRPLQIYQSGIASASEPVLGLLALKVMERHPYTTQTFSPLGLNARDAKAGYLVVVAPALPSLGSGIGGPDMQHAKAFLARGDQAVTYGMGTWHAPMIALGRRNVSFLVTQFVNGVPEEDCEEVGVGGRDRIVEVVVPWRFQTGSKL